MRRRKTFNESSINTSTNTDIEESPWKDMLASNVSASRRRASHQLKMREKIQECSRVIVNFNEQNPEEILIALETAGLYDITIARREALLQM